MKTAVKIAAALTVATGVVTNTTAYATSWYSKTSPLVASDDGSKRAGAYGASYIENGSYARVSSYQKDYRPGGNSVYVDTDYKYWTLNDVYELAWVEMASKETARSNTSAWVYHHTHHTLMGEPDRVRTVTHVCEDQRFSGDPCSVNVIETLGY